jgi:putative FmdB family regulatory protein
MAIYDHLCSSCNQEFELEYSVKEDPPTKCPLCGHDGMVKRLISYAAPGKVEIYGHELKAKIKEDAKKMVADAGRNENMMANIIGESKYQSKISQYDRDSRGRPKIKTRR